mgnify:CR=1 FL=1
MNLGTMKYPRRRESTVVAACAAARVTHLGAGGMPDRVWPVDLRPTPEGGFVLLDAFGPRIIETDAAFRPQRVFECGVELPGGAARGGLIATKP